MPQSRHARRRERTRRIRYAGLLVVVAVLGALSQPWSTSSSSTVASPNHVVPAEPPRARGRADGAVPGRATARIPGAANLDADLHRALRRAAKDAADDGVALVVDSGWRSPEHQEQLLREAIAEYGSEAEARRWVATPETSAHVSGDAVDVGPSEAAAWLSGHGAQYGLCQIYGNEPWHYELRPEAGRYGCPAMYADPTHDPRMQQ
ncbi:MAG TPA: M15 family metallopeptidase [Solirubrobacteraceae bacterium]|nr:M15 family metallopeptidase [Solirubrobacteraceae bacterium]